MLKKILLLSVVSAGSIAFAGNAKLDLLPCGDVMPEGWLKKQMELELRDGLPGNYQKVSDYTTREIFVKKDGAHGLSYKIPNERNTAAWWVGEIEGNWTDSVIRLAILTGNEQWKKYVKEYYYRVIAAQDPDGYIGCYNKASRFYNLEDGRDKKSNGELWTQSRLYQGMIAYYEYSKDEKIFEALKKAVDCTIKNYLGKRVFGERSGTAHGIAFTDTLEWMHRKTGDKKYVDTMVWLYEDFSNNSDDNATKEIAYQELAKPDALWFSHTPHLMEGIHIPIVVYTMTGDKKYKPAVDNLFLKYDRHDTPGGGVVGSEMVDKRLGNCSMPREVCTLVSAQMGLSRIAAWSGDIDVLKRAEMIGLNSSQAAKFQPSNIAVRYLTYDNQDDASSHKAKQRFLYSAWHDAAPCCATTMGRMMPYYVEGMFLKNDKENTLYATLFAPAKINTTLNGKKISFDEITKFPFSDEIEFKFNEDAEFNFVLRNPQGSGALTVDAGKNAKIELGETQTKISGKWKKGDSIKIKFNFDLKLVAEKTMKNSFYYQWGPMMFSLPLGDEKKTIKEFVSLDGKPSGFHMWEVRPKNPQFWNNKIDPEEPFEKVDLPDGDYEIPYAKPPFGFKGRMMDKDQNSVDVILTPLGSSLLKRTSFPDYMNPLSDEKK